MLGAALLGGCATPGPNHVYLATAGNHALADLGPPAALLTHVLQPGEQAAGLAYDFNTDHLFVRVSPSHVIRVVERPSGKVLREMPLPREWNDRANADLAIRSKDRSIFAVVDDRMVAAFTRFGRFTHRPELFGLDGPIGGLAYDQKRDRLVVLVAGSPARIGFYSAGGTVTGYVMLAAHVRPVSLGYDSDAQRFFVPLADGDSLGEFDFTGKLIATHPAGGAITAIDAGPRSFVRVF